MEKYLQEIYGEQRRKGVFCGQELYTAPDVVVCMEGDYAPPQKRMQITCRKG